MLAVLIDQRRAAEQQQGEDKRRKRRAGLIADRDRPVLAAHRQRFGMKEVTGDAGGGEKEEPAGASDDKVEQQLEDVSGFLRAMREIEPVESRVVVGNQCAHAHDQQREVGQENCHPLKSLCIPQFHRHRDVLRQRKWMPPGKHHGSAIGAHPANLGTMNPRNARNRQALPIDEQAAFGTAIGRCTQVIAAGRAPVDRNRMPGSEARWVRCRLEDPQPFVKRSYQCR